ncbi:lysM and putative peptidoglycan-binding domain-containing protein 3 [Musca vetustissima]|uniref:lysM and putative peptidoglycan-binding domain-containing protein 3 n=1 Tax=Musca vetustissima TaxID=27455 RepID=UPI002AB705ED|nr:lysM and putative peptidoglycan-binding domain-containing protein 3 [Musca vetustissima]
MRRNARSISNHENDDYHHTSPTLLFTEPPSTSTGTEDFLQMERLSTRQNKQQHRFENTIEAKVEPGDTLQAIALRFHCSVADIKRLNKIDKDNEIHARKVVKIPVTVHNVLLDNLPIVHKSGNSSPKINQKSSSGNDSRDSDSGLSSIVRNPLDDAEAMLSEKLMVASVNSSSRDGPSTSRCFTGRDEHVNNIIMNSKLKATATGGAVNIYTDEELAATDMNDASAPLITDILDDSTNVPHIHRIKGPSLRAIDWSGSDCDMSWICLFVVILALCFVIPLVYVVYIAEHAHHNITGSSTTVASAAHH